MLWEQFTQSVRPLTQRPAVPAPASRPDRAGHAAPAASAMPAAPVRKAVPPIEPIERRQRQRLARGMAAIDARLDLHGRTQAQAHAALLRFLRQAQSDGARFVLVITGKGSLAGSDGSERGVLKRQVPLWLREPKLRGYVSAFEQAHIVHGGEGALYVRLRRPRRAD
jgi:DNA-nicking Smr family endonuclease